jgi:uracil-DNA glycosylase
MAKASIEPLLAEVQACRACAAHLPLGPRPVLQIHPAARILIAAQAPGRKVHASGIPFDDASGERLRDWLGMPRGVFYNPRLVAILPMALCYPGTGRSGDLPPRPECAGLWRAKLMAHLRHVQLTLVIGQYAQAYHLPGAGKPLLTERVRDWGAMWPHTVALPHPSPRNNIWLRRNPWFESELLPALRPLVQQVLEADDEA